jgi:hypothetical protein
MMVNTYYYSKRKVQDKKVTHKIVLNILISFSFWSGAGKQGYREDF